MDKIYRILGKRGRTTVPYELRVKMGMDDLTPAIPLSLQLTDIRSVFPRSPGRITPPGKDLSFFSFICLHKTLPVPGGRA